MERRYLHLLSETISAFYASEAFSVHSHQQFLLLLSHPRRIHRNTSSLLCFDNVSSFSWAMVLTTLHVAALAQVIHVSQNWLSKHNTKQKIERFHLSINPLDSSSYIDILWIWIRFFPEILQYYVIVQTLWRLVALTVHRVGHNVLKPGVSEASSCFNIVDLDYAAVKT